MDEQRKNELTAEADGIIEGRNAVIEALRAGDLAGGKQLFAQVETDYQALVAALSQVGNG